MSIVNTLSLESNRQIKINFNGGDLSSDAGLLLIKEFVSKLGVDQHIIIWHFRRIKLCRNNAGIFHPRTPGILVITVIEKIITVITRLKMGYFNFPDSANYGIK